MIPYIDWGKFQKLVSLKVEFLFSNLFLAICVRHSKLLPFSPQVLPIQTTIIAKGNLTIGGKYNLPKKS